MPRKRPIEVRLAEQQAKLDALRDEKRLQELKARMAHNKKRRPRRRRRTT